MSTTDKLAQCPFCGNAVDWCAIPEDPNHECHMIQCPICGLFDLAGDDPADTIEELRLVVTTRFNRRASQSTPAGEVTADAVEVACAFRNWCELREAQKDKENATLSAANARLAKDAERWCTLVALVHAEEWNGWDVLVPPNLKREAEGDLVAAVDAATAQAKQAEGGK